MESIHQWSKCIRQSTDVAIFTKSTGKKKIYIPTMNFLHIINSCMDLPHCNYFNNYIIFINLKAQTSVHSTCCTTMKCTHCQKDFCCPVSAISASYSQLPSSKDNAIVCPIQKALPTRVGKSTDVRYRSFHNFNQSSKQVTSNVIMIQISIMILLKLKISFRIFTSNE